MTNSRAQITQRYLVAGLSAADVVDALICFPPGAGVSATVSCSGVLVFRVVSDSAWCLFLWWIEVRRRFHVRAFVSRVRARGLIGRVVLAIYQPRHAQRVG